MWLDIIQAYLLIFVAELGDKSQFLAMTMATKYKTRTVMLGVFIGVLVNHAIAIAFGSVIQTVLSPQLIMIVVGLIFITFGLLSIWSTSPHTVAKQYSVPSYLAIAILFFVGEFGDKTQFATMALSLDSSTPWLLLIGTVGAMMSTSILGIWIGRLMGRTFPERSIKLFSSFAFTGYGVFRLSALANPLWITILMIAGFAVVYLFLAIRYVAHTKRINLQLQQAAEHLKQFYGHLTKSMDVICLGKDVCGSCQLSGCLIGHVKYLIEEGKAGRSVTTVQLNSKVVKHANPERIQIALELTLSELVDHWTDPAFATLHQIRQSLEHLLFQTSIPYGTITDYFPALQELQTKKGVS